MHTLHWVLWFMLWFILPAFLTTRIWEQTTMGLPPSSSKYLSCFSRHTLDCFTTHHFSGTQRCRFYSNISFPISRSYLYFCSQTTYFFREVAWLSQWTARKLKVQRQDSVVLLVEPCISFSPTSSLGTSPGCSKVMIDWSIAPNLYVTTECDMVYVESTCESVEVMKRVRF